MIHFLLQNNIDSGIQVQSIPDFAVDFEWTVSNGPFLR
jgi:hypothetical protein